MERHVRLFCWILRSSFVASLSIVVVFCLVFCFVFVGGGGGYIYIVVVVVVFCFFLPPLFCLADLSG